MALQIEVEKSIDKQGETLFITLRIWPDGADTVSDAPDVEEPISQHIKAESQHPDPSPDVPGAKFTAQELIDEAVAEITKRHKAVIQKYQSRTSKLALVDEAAIKTELEKVVV